MMRRRANSPVAGAVGPARPAETRGAMWAAATLLRLLHSNGSKPRCCGPRKLGDTHTSSRDPIARAWEVLRDDSSLMEGLNMTVTAIRRITRAQALEQVLNDPTLAKVSLSSLAKRWGVSRSTARGLMKDGLPPDVPARRGVSPHGLWPSPRIGERRRHSFTLRGGRRKPSRGGDK
jgi:hypothetical protein